MVRQQIEHLRFAPQASTRDAKSGAQGSTNNHPCCAFDSRVFAVQLIVVVMSLENNLEGSVVKMSDALGSEMAAEASHHTIKIKRTPSTE